MTTLAELITLNISNRVRVCHYYSSSVFRQEDGSVIYINILNSVDDKKPAQNLCGEICFLKMEPYFKLVPLHPTILHYLHYPGAKLILQQSVEKLLQQL